MEEKHIGMVKQLIIMLLSVLVFVTLDQWTKHLAVLYLKGQDSVVLIQGVFELRYLQNRGAAFGMFENQRIVFLVVTNVIMLVVLYAYFKFPVKKRYLPLHIIFIFILSGAVGNMIDRCIQGYVVDFLYFSLIDFPIFNVADIYVTVSCVVFILLGLLYYKDEDYAFLAFKKKSQASDTTNDIEQK